MTPFQPESTYDIRLTLAVRDAAALWAAAVSRGLAAPGATIDDLIDVIGPREDPSIGDCLAMLLAPAGVAGCDLGDFAVEATAPTHLERAIDTAARVRAATRCN